MSSIVMPSSVTDATILHQVSHEEDEDEDTAAITTANNNNNLSQHSTIQQNHPSATSLNAQVVNTSMSNEEQIGLSLSPSPPSTSLPSSNNEVINQIANQVSNEILSTVVNSTVEQHTADNSIQNANDNNQINAEGVDITASLLPKPRQQQQPVDNTQNSSSQQQAKNSTNQQQANNNSTVIDQQQKVVLEERIQTLELNINTLTELCQSLLLQQQQQVMQQVQGKIRHHSREGSEATGTSSGSNTPNTPTHTLDHSSSSTQLLSQWPPTNHHPLLESPDATLNRKRLKNAKRRSSSSSSTEGGKTLSKNGKTMSMVLLDINPGESRGPSLVPFTSDLDACDEMDGDSVAGGCRDGAEKRGNTSSSREGGSSRSSVDSIDTSSRSDSGCSSIESSPVKKQKKKQRGASDDGGSTNSSSNESSSSTSYSSPSPARRRQRGARRLSSSLKEHGNNNLECQAYTTTHLEALRLRREAGREDRRAYSFNDSMTTPPPNSQLRKQFEQQQQQSSKKDWKPSLDVVDGSVAPDSVVSIESTGTFVDTRPPEEEGGDTKSLNHQKIIMPDLSLLDKNWKDDESMAIPPSEKNTAKSTATTCQVDTAQQTKEKVVTGTSKDTPDKTSIRHSTSCASNMSSDTSKTIKSGNINKEALLSARKNRSQSISSSTSATTTRDTSASGTAAAESEKASTTVTPKKRNSSTTATKVKSPDKTNQTMKEYVINDLLNIDSRNQDGSATEDIDANMEEFLRVPSKLENLMIFSLAVCMDSFLYAWAMLPLKFVWGIVCMICSVVRPKGALQDIRFHRRHLYPMMQSALIYFVYSQVLCPISIGKLYHWIRGQAMLKLYVLIAIVEVFDRLLCSFGQDAWDSLYWNTTKRPKHPRMFVSFIVVGVYVIVHSLFLFVHVATLSVAVNSADNALLTLLISGNFAEIKSTVFKKYNKQNLFKITTSDICERFKLGLFLLLILFLNRFQGEMTTSMVHDYYSMCGIVFAAELISDWIKHSFITKFNLIKSSIYFDYALILSGDVTGIGHEGLNLDYTHAAVKRLGLAQIPLVCVTARYLHEAVRFAIAFQGNGDVDHPVAALVDLVADGNRWKFYTGLMQGMAALVLFKIVLGICIRIVARHYLGGPISNRISKSSSQSTSRKSSCVKSPPKESSSDTKKKQ